MHARIIPIYNMTCTMRRCLSSMKLYLNNQIDLLSNYIKSQIVYAFITDKKKKKNFKFVLYIKVTVIECGRIVHL